MAVVGGLRRHSAQRSSSKRAAPSSRVDKVSWCVRLQLLSTGFAHELPHLHAERACAPLWCLLLTLHEQSAQTQGGLHGRVALLCSV